MAVARRLLASRPVRACWLVVLLLLATGCVRVRPYQRETLAQPIMQAPPWPALEPLDEHLFEVREGTGGATGAAGGGCGCN